MARNRSEIDRIVAARVSKLAQIALVVLCCMLSQPAAAAVHWITHPAAAGSKGREAVALHFRRDVELKTVPPRARVRVSADNRFVLYVNGRRVAEGPARGDLSHWRYRTVDLRPFLRRGRNVLAAQVWNDGPHAAIAQISARTAFFVSSEEPQLRDVGTGPGWRVRIDLSRSVSSAQRQLAKSVGPASYYAASPPEAHDASLYRKDWLAAVTTATDWVPAVEAVEAGGPPPWTLVEDALPPMEHIRLPGGSLVRANGAISSRFPEEPLAIPANSTTTLLLDAGKVQAAYPELVVSGGAGAEISLTYSEALYGSDKKYLRDRAAVDGGEALGLTDSFRPDGTTNSAFRPFWWRTWRFVKVHVKTAAAPIRLESFNRNATGYPFQQRGRFHSSDPELNRIWSIGWDTVRLDAHETYMDTAYWEQLQYVGDTRIQAFVSYLVSGDPRLAVQAIQAFDDSRFKGITQSRWPSKEPQSIPPFALLWIGMLHDYWLHQPDQAPLRRSLEGARSVLDWYGGYVGAKGLVGTTPGWEFIDWRPTLSNVPWAKERPETDQCIITLMYIGALRQAAELQAELGDASRASTNKASADRLAKAVVDQCWSAERGLFADTPAKTSFSQHVNILAVLYDVAPKSDHAGILQRITVRNGGIAAPPGITGTTYYFAFYLARALEHAGLADRYLELMPSWRAMLAQNFTTWPEEPDPTRSDSHAWSAHPTADLLRLVAGIRPGSSGYRSVRIAPNLGTLTRLDAAMATPRGLVSVNYKVGANVVDAVIRMPPGLTGSLEWRGETYPLRAGTSRLKLPTSACRHTSKYMKDGCNGKSNK